MCVYADLLRKWLVQIHMFVPVSMFICLCMFPPHIMLHMIRVCVCVGVSVCVKVPVSGSAEGGGL